MEHRYQSKAHPKVLEDFDKKNNNIAELILLLNDIDVDSSEAELNATTISDNNGGRIIL